MFPSLRVSVTAMGQLSREEPKTVYRHSFYLISFGSGVKVMITILVAFDPFSVKKLSTFLENKWFVCTYVGLFLCRNFWPFLGENTQIKTLTPDPDGVVVNLKMFSYRLARPQKIS
jgi:hypothetical protein